MSYVDSSHLLVSSAKASTTRTGRWGDGDMPLVLLQHFRGNLGNGEPALVDALAATRRVIAFGNAGVGGSTGTTPRQAEQQAAAPTAGPTR